MEGSEHPVDYGTGLVRCLENDVVAILEQGASTRVALARVLGVSRPVLGRALADLLAEGFVRTCRDRGETDTRPRGRGRPVERLSLDPGRVYAIGVDVSRCRAVGVLQNRAGRVVARVRVGHEGFSEWDEPLHDVLAGLEDEACQGGLDLEHVAEVGVGLPVPVDLAARAGQGSLPPLMAQEREELARRYGATVIIGNTAHMAALGEARWGAGAHAPSQFYLRLAAGVSGAVIVADTLTGGSNGYAGEVGHVRVPGSRAACQCGKRGCLETVASVPAVLAHAGSTDLADLRRALDAGDRRATTAVQEAATAVALVCASVVLALNPALVVLGGDLMHMVPEIVDLVASQTEQEIPPALHMAVPVRPARLGDDAGALGAIAAVDSLRAALRATRILAPEAL